MRTYAVGCAIAFAVSSSSAAACPQPGAAQRLQLKRPSEGLFLSGFGMRRHPLLQTTKMHTGIDYSGSIGDPVRSAAAGKVLKAGVAGEYGKVVVLDHGGGMETTYAHLSQIEVQEGACVEQGAVIGRLGSTGLASGPRLHFEVRMQGRYVDPLVAIAEGAQ